MRIMLVVHTASAWAEPFANYFKARGDTVLVASFSPNPMEGIDTAYIGSRSVLPFAKKHVFITGIPRLRKAIRAFEPDIVFAIYLASNGLSAALAWKGPLAVAAVGSDVLDRLGRTGLRRAFREYVIRLVCRKADIINTVSQGLDDELLRLGVPKAKLLQIPFGVDTAAFYPAQEVPRRSATRFICTRRHAPIYDIPTIIEALRICKAQGMDFNCVLTSGGAKLEENRRKAINAGLQDCVTFTGTISYDDLPGLLRNADIYISASLGDGTSVSLLEAMATGLLPVVSDIEPNKPWVTDGQTGLLFKTGSPQDLARALGRAVEDHELRQRAYDTNRKRVMLECDKQRNLQRLTEAFERLIAEKRH
jgi:L-malate glycosyltransferase